MSAEDKQPEHVHGPDCQHQRKLECKICLATPCYVCLCGKILCMMCVTTHHCTISCKHCFDIDKKTLKCVKCAEFYCMICSVTHDCKPK